MRGWPRPLLIRVRQHLYNLFPSVARRFFLRDTRGALRFVLVGLFVLGDYLHAVPLGFPSRLPVSSKRRGSAGELGELRNTFALAGVFGVFLSGDSFQLFFYLRNTFRSRSMKAGKGRGFGAWRGENRRGARGFKGLRLVASRVAFCHTGFIGGASVRFIARIPSRL